MSILDSHNIEDWNLLPKLKDLFKISVSIQPRAIDKQKCARLGFDDISQYNTYFEQLIEDVQVNVRWQCTLHTTIQYIVDNFIKTKPFQSGMERHLTINLSYDNMACGRGGRATVSDATGINYMVVDIVPTSDYYQNFHWIQLNFI